MFLLHPSYWNVSSLRVDPCLRHFGVPASTEHINLHMLVFSMY